GARAALPALRSVPDDVHRDESDPGQDRGGHPGAVLVGDAPADVPDQRGELQEGRGGAAGCSGTPSGRGVSGAVPLKLIVHGASGRMGRQVIAAAAGAHDVTVAAALVRPGSPLLGQDAGTVAGVGPLDVPLSDNVAGALEHGDVVVDFSVPAATVALVGQATQVGRPTVVATTGLSPEQVDAIKS